MKKIIITQRNDFFEEIGEVRESIDQNLSRLVIECGYFPIQISSVCNTKMMDGFLTSINPAGIILSGGNDIGSKIDRDNFENSILKWSISAKVPVLGICRGMQMINRFEGGTLEKTDDHVQVTHVLAGSENFGGLEVNSFHHFKISEKTLGNHLTPLAYAEDVSVEAFRHDTYLWMGIMWHPERENKFKLHNLNLFQKHFGGTNESNNS